MNTTTQCFFSCLANKLPGKRPLVVEPNDNRLFALLNINTGEEVVDDAAITQEVRRNPQFAARKYEFTVYYEDGWDVKCTAFPLHHAFLQGANINTIRAIYDSYPTAIKEKYEGHRKFNDKTVLHVLLCEYGSIVPTELVSFVLDRFPEAVYEKDYWRNDTPLHCACEFGASLEVMSLLIEAWPDAAKTKNINGVTPLHLAAQDRMIDIVVLLLDQCPQAIREKDSNGNTALHWACSGEESLEIMLLLIEKWPEAILEVDNKHIRPLDAYEVQADKDDDVKKLLSYVYKLYNGGIGDDLCREMMSFFIEIEWRNGVFLILDRHPHLKNQIYLETNRFPYFLSGVGQRCNTKTMWYMISNKIEIIEGA